MKLLICEEELGKLPPPKEPRRQLFGAGPRFLERQPPQREYTDEIISQLTDLGFSRRLALDALNRSRGSIELSIEYLLTLPPNIIEEDKEKEAKEQDKSVDVNMEKEEEKQVEQDMDVDNLDIVV